MGLSIKGESKLLVKHSLIYGLGNILNKVTAVILLPLYTTYLTPTDYGIKELVGLTADVIGLLLATAISSAFYRFYFEYQGEEDRKEVVSTAVLAVGGAGLLAVAMLAPFSASFAFYILDSAGLSHFFLIGLVSMWFQMLSDIGFNYLRARMQSILVVTLSVAKLLLSLLLNIYFIVSLELGVLGILLSTLISSAALAAVQLVPIFRFSGFRFSRSKLKAMLVFGYPLIVSQFGAFVVHLSDRFFIKNFLSVADTGLYSLAHRIGELPTHFVSGPFNQVWLPRRLEIYKLPDAERVFGRIFTYFLGLMFFAGLAISVLARDVLRIIATEAFWPAHGVVPLIALGAIVFSMHYHVNLGLLIEKKTKYLAAINLSNAALVLVLNYFLIRKYGVYGAAIAALTAFAVKVTLTYHFSCRFCKVYLELARIGKLLLASGVIYAASFYVTAESPYLSMALRSAMVCLLPVCLLLLGFFTADELTNARVLFRRLVPFLRRPG